MTADTIKALAECIPDNCAGRRYAPPSVVLGPEKRFGFPVDRGLNVFVQLYKNTAIGWHSAAIFASQGMDFPIAMKGKDQWIFKAYLYCLDPDTYKDKNIAEAILLAHPEMKGMRDVIEALLLCHEINGCKEISQLTGMDIRTIEAYEKLFFNVLDRRKDYMYIRNIVYPDSRLVEWYDGYSGAEDPGMILKRYGYNFGGKELFYLSGLPKHMLDEIPAAISSGKLESVIMSQGYLLTKLGFTNQSKHTNALYHSKGLLAAAKQGGQDNSDHAPLSRVSDILVDTFKTQSSKVAEKMVNQRNKIKYESGSVTS